MKIYKVIARFYDHFYYIDRSGFKTVEKYFSTRKKAEVWIEENRDFAYGYNSTKVQNDYQKPSFEIMEIEVL